MSTDPRATDRRLVCIAEIDRWDRWLALAQGFLAGALFFTAFALALLFMS